MGTVVRALHLVRRAPVALKFLKSEMIGVEDSAARLLREGVATSSIPSEHVVTILDVGQLPSGVPYLVMELLEGRDLAVVLRDDGNPGLPVPRAIHFTLQVLRALQAAHVRGIIHRDLKPSNCFATVHEGEVDFIKVLDFGVSKLRMSGEGLTQSGTVLGTFAYMAPEQALSPKDADARSDLYSVGVCFYKLLAGELPFKSDAARDVARAAIAVFEGRAIPIQRWLPDIDPALAEVIHKALSRDPEGRFSRAAEMAEALAPWADERSSVVLQRIRKLERESNRPKVPRVRADASSPSEPDAPTRSQLGAHAPPIHEAPTASYALPAAPPQGMSPASPAPRTHVAMLLRLALVVAVVFALTYGVVHFLAGH